jgi:hypothetical protein
MDAGH